MLPNCYLMGNTKYLLKQKCQGSSEILSNIVLHFLFGGGGDVTNMAVMDGRKCGGILPNPLMPCLPSMTSC